MQGSLRIDSSAPALTGAPVLSKSSGRYRAGEPVAFTFTASEELTRAPEASLLTDPAIPFVCTAGAERTWSCTTAALTGAETPAGPTSALVELADQAGNTGADGLGLVLDFQPPGLVAGTADLALEPPPGSLASTVSRLGAGGRVRITFTVDEALAAAPELVASPAGALAFTLANQASMTYAYEAVLPDGPVAQGAYGVEARLTDLAGNTSHPALTFRGAGLAVDTVPPAPPDVSTLDRIVYDMVPWGSAATGGRPAFTVVGSSGAVEAGAMVVAFDGADAATANELGRTVASTSGAFTLALASDAGALHLVAVDDSGTPGDGDAGLPGVQGVKVRDVTWTATLGGKVVGSIGANPHVLEARARFGEDLEGGSSEEVIVPASTRPTVSLRPAGPTTWTPPSVVVKDPVRGVLVGFGGASGGSSVMEFDGAEWRTFANAYGPNSVQAAAFHPRLREVLVYAGSCDGGAVLWSWNGRRWKVRGEGISYPGQLEASSRTVPGPHPNSNLAYHEARGELVLTGGVMGSPYQCGDVAGRPDMRTWTWTEAGWSLREDVPTAGPTAYDPVSESLVTVTASGFSSWDGTSVVETAISDPEQDGNPVFHSQYWLPPFAIDPATGTRILLDGQTWWSDGHSWVRGATSAAGVLVADEPGRRLLLADADGLAAWRSGGWERVVAPTVPSPAPSPISMIWNAGANRLELFTSDGQVLAWQGVRWAAIAPGDPEGDGNPSTLSAAAADPLGGGVLATSSGDLWRWTGSSWAWLMAGMPSPGDLLTWPGAGVYRRHDNDWARWTGFAWEPVPDTTQFPQSLGDLRFAGYSPSLGGFVASYTVNYVGDSRVSTWHPTTGWATRYTEYGFGSVRALPADGFGRTYALHDATRLYLLGGDPFAAAAAVENPLQVALPAGYSAAAWNPSEGATFVWAEGTWRLDTEPTSELGHLLRIAYAASGGPALEACLDPAACAVRSVHLEWAGRASTDEGVAPNRVRLLAWGGVRWLELASAEGSAGADLHASATVLDPGLIGRMAAGPDAELDFAIRTSGPHTRDALLRTDDVSVTVRYRLR